MQACRTCTAAAALFLAAAAPRTLMAQERLAASDLGKIVGGNVALGATTAAVRAAFSGKPVARAFLTGAMGGLVHGSGKVLIPRAGLAGTALGAVGASV